VTVAAHSHDERMEACLARELIARVDD
jgi:hypothetical protein